MTPIANAPRGLGVYLRRGIVSWTGSEAVRQATRMAAARVRWAALMIEGVDGPPVPLDALERAAEVLREHGITPWLWTFPDAAEVDVPTALERIARARERTRPAGVILDIETPPRGRAPADAWVRQLVAGVAAQGGSVGITSYPLPAYHRTMPWAAMLPAGGSVWGSPQLYRSAFDPMLVARSWVAWSDGGRRALVPAVPAYDVTAGRLAADEQLRQALARTCLDAQGRLRAQGAVLWSEPQIDAAERRVLAEWADRWGW